jgi:WD40 repeat protein/basic membrane lipoprotein Med (substrate-binding protein (PBP1-ABC) superfamily)
MSPSIPSGTLEKFTTFGDLLRYLRRLAGLTQLELSIQVGYSHAQISRLEQNLRLPDIPTIEARFVPALGVENEPHVVTRLLDLAANIRREDAPGLGLCPYKGLYYFDESDADVFVGREALTAKLTERLLSLTSSHVAHETRFLAVVGASGSGKSSLVRAGVVPSLRWDKSSADWQIYVITPTAHPLENLATSLTYETRSIIATTTFMDEMQKDFRSLQVFAKRRLQAQEKSHLLLVVDQFEELFALCRSEEERAAYIGNLLTAASEPEGPLTILITLRADFYAHCADYVPLRETLSAQQEYIGAMNHAELRRVIEEPVRRGRWELESGLVDLLLHDVGREPGALPLLSHALFETWQRRRGRTMTLGGYISSGGIRAAIAETAETVFSDQFTHEQKRIARRIFLRLTELHDENSMADTRRRAKLRELILKPEEAEDTHEVLTALAEARLITIHEDTVEVAHEALIREWPTLCGWLEENRESLRLHRQLTDISQEWLTKGYSDDLLYRGARLAQIREWDSVHHGEMNALECEFLAASMEQNEREAADREAQRQRELEAARRLADSERRRAQEQTDSAKRLRKRAIYLAGAFAVALVMAVAALFFGGQARAASHLATSRELAAASLSNLAVDPERSILLALQALDTSYTIEAEDALHQAIQASHMRRVIEAHEPGAPVMLAFSPDDIHFVSASADGSVKIWDAITGDPVLRLEGYYAAYRPDGKEMAIFTTDDTVHMVDPATGREIYVPGPIDTVKSIAFSPDGSRLVTVTANNIPRIWNATTGKELVAFPGHTDFVGNATFSPDGTRLLTASDDGTSRVWDANTGKQLLSFDGPPGWIWTARYSPNGKRIVTVSGNEAILWDAESGKKLLNFVGHTNQIYAVAFSPDGTRLATGGEDRKIKIWDTSTGNELLSLSGHSDAIYSVLFNPDGTQLLSASGDGTIRFWDLTPSHELLALAAHGSSGQIAFSADGNLLATTDNNGVIKLWDAHSGKSLASFSNLGNEIRGLAFNGEGTYIFIVSSAGLKVLDVATGRESDSLSTGNLNGIVISSDGNYLATAGNDFKANIWNLTSGKIDEMPVYSFQHSGAVTSITFNQDATQLATGTQDGTVRLWNLATGKDVQVLRGHTDFVSAIAVSPDGKQIASSSADSTAIIWSSSTGQALFTLQGHNDAVMSIAYSPDGKRIGTASRDGTAKLWDAVTGEEVLTFSGDGSGLTKIAFSRDGTRLAIGGDNGTRVYLLSIKDLIALAKTRVTRTLTSEECQKYLHLSSTACSSVQSTPTTTAMPPADHGRICQVTTIAGLYDHSFNEMTFHGLKLAATQFDWDYKILQSNSIADYGENIREFMRGDCDLVVGLGQMQDAIQSAAQENPNQKFLMPDTVYDPPLMNVRTPIFAVDQASFLAGYAAASVTKTGKVGIFGGVDIPSVTDFMDGFVLGVRYYNQKNGTNVDVLGWNREKHQGLFIDGFCCSSEGRQLTKQLLDQGADIIFPVAGSKVAPGVAYVAKTQSNIYIIGVDTDWFLTEPEYADILLTSVIKNYDVSVVQAAKALAQKKFAGGVQAGTLSTGEVNLAPFHKLDSLVPTKVKTDLEQIKKDIIAGKIRTKP